MRESQSKSASCDSLKEVQGGGGGGEAACPGHAAAATHRRRAAVVEGGGGGSVISKLCNSAAAAAAAAAAQINLNKMPWRTWIEKSLEAFVAAQLMAHSRQGDRRMNI